MSGRRPGDDDWIFDPELAAMGRRARQELREEAEEVESIVAESELRERTLADVAREARNRGDFVGIATTRRTFNGYIVYAAGDFVTIRTDSFEADINLADAAYLRTIERGRGGGRSGEEGPGTFEMRLVERKSPHDRVELGYRAIEETVIGIMAAVGQDHVVIIDDHKVEWSIPHTSIAYLIKRGRRTR